VQDLLPPGQTLNLAGLVEYARGAIVSKTLVDREKGTVTLFAFDQDQRLSEHSAPFDALVFVVEGQAGVVVGGNPVQVPAGHMVVLPANVPHAVTAAERFKMLLVMIRA
jgi:quercetin dioxygenase-like cupin family protein